MEDYNWKDKTILVAEDDDFNFIVLEEILKYTKANVIRKENGKEAVIEFYSNSNVDIVLMDIEMPVMDGITATREIRKTNNKVPIIMLTAYAIRYEEAESLKAGSNYFLTKPIEEDKILGIINSYF